MSRLDEPHQIEAAEGRAGPTAWFRSGNLAGNLDTPDPRFYIAGTC
jgi:hypothetical protein